MPGGSAAAAWRARSCRRLRRSASAKGFRRIDLNVLDWNPARGFYERIGFKWIRNWLPYRLSGEALEKLASRNCSAAAGSVCCWSPKAASAGDRGTSSLMSCNAIG